MKGTKKTNRSGEKGLCFESKVFPGKQRLNILEKGLNQERHFFKKNGILYHIHKLQLKQT